MLYSRIRLTSKKYHKELLTHCNPGQIEKKWGGKFANVKRGHWPPKVPNTNFYNRYESRKLETKQQFKEKF
jgi:hypothetical protein